MNIVVHMTECKPHSTIASARVARFIVQTLPEFLLVDTAQKAEECLEKTDSQGLDTLIIVNGPMAFCDFLEPLARLVANAEKIVWVQQDYTINPPAQVSKAESPFRKAFADKKLRPVYWTTVQKNVLTSQDSYVNWNQLTWDPQPVPRVHEEPVLLYYGAYREKRHDCFVKWLADAPYKVRVSTTPIRGKKFKSLCDKIEIIPPFSSLKEMPSCRASLYIEDAKSHVEFHSPANRLYELLSAGVPVFFDSKTIPMLAKAAFYVPDEWIVSTQKDLHTKLENATEDMVYEQRRLWSKDYVGELRQQVLDAWEKLY